MANKKKNDTVSSKQKPKQKSKLQKLIKNAEKL